jgi:hypothetical protein
MDTVANGRNSPWWESNPDPQVTQPVCCLIRPANSFPNKWSLNYVTISGHIPVLNGRVLWGLRSAGCDVVQQEQLILYSEVQSWWRDIVQCGTELMTWYCTVWYRDSDVIVYSVVQSWWRDIVQCGRELVTLYCTMWYRVSDVILYSVVQS